MLIVFLFAAVVAIMLYRELPVTLFEAQRQKEQLLVDRGHEYQRAIQLYYRKFRGQFPANIEQLESTNNMRFLRHRFKDPFTGKDDWRILHMGPGGMLTDSKVNPINPNGQNPNGANATNANGNSATAANTGFGSAAPTGFTNNTPSDSDGAQVIVPQIPQRGPAILAAGAARPGGTPSSNELDQDPATPLLPNTSSVQLAIPAGGANQPQGEQAAGANAIVAPGQQILGANPQQQGNNAMQMVQNLIASSNTGQATAFGGAVRPNSTMGRVMSGGMAGVASKAEGHSVKVVNDQSDYSLWEFYYDPSKDTSMGTALRQQMGATGFPAQNGAIGVPPTASGFGSTSPSGLTFGNANPTSGQTGTDMGQGVQGTPVTIPATPNGTAQSAISSNGPNPQ